MMKISALLTSAGINIGVCVLFFSLYSILRKQPGNASVYFGRRLAQFPPKRKGHLCFERFVPSPSWIVKAWETPEEELLAAGGVDSVVFLRIIVFSLRIFSIAAFICISLVLPVNYYGQMIPHKEIPSESLDVFTIGNIKQGSKWLWAHCLALYIITSSACALLYFEYKSIANMRLKHIQASSTNPSHFSVLVRAIPWCPQCSYSDQVKKFFQDYHGAHYLGHQMVHRSGAVQMLVTEAQMMCHVLKADNFAQKCKPKLFHCGLCSGSPGAFRILADETNSVKMKPIYRDLDPSGGQKEVAAAFVFFKTRYAAAVVASQALQSSNPMLWVVDLAPEPHDVYWSNLCIPYRQLWFRKIAIRIGAIFFMLLFLAPVAFVQSLTHLDQLHKTFPFLRKILEKKFMDQLITGYLPSVILILFLYTVPPTMMLFSSVEGFFSRSDRKKSACIKVLYFMIWNVFFVNIFSGSVFAQFNVVFNPKTIPTTLARAIPTQASFFMTYVLTSGWASLSSELMQPVALIWCLIKRFILRSDDVSSSTLSFPYHTEVPKVLLFGHLGFTYSIMAPLMLPLILVYFFLAFLVYRNQILNVYVSKYESGGQLWPTVHNTTIFSLVFTQFVALGVFGLKRSPIASGFTIPLVILTLLFNEYCRQRFSPIFKSNAAQMLMDMDREDEQNGRMDEIHKQLHSAYCQFTLSSQNACQSKHNDPDPLSEGSIQDAEATASAPAPGKTRPVEDDSWRCNLQDGQNEK